MIDWKSFKLKKNEAPRPEGCICEWTLDPIIGPDKFTVKTAPCCPVHGWRLPYAGDEWHSPT